MSVRLVLPGFANPSFAYLEGDYISTTVPLEICYQELVPELRKMRLQKRIG